MRTVRAGVSLSMGASQRLARVRAASDGAGPGIRAKSRVVVRVLRPGSAPCSVCVVTTSYPSFDGDPAGHFVKAEVAELEAAGHTVTVVTPPAGGAFGWPGAAFRLRENPFRALEAGRWMARAAPAIRAARPDLVIAHW